MVTTYKSPVKGRETSRTLRRSSVSHRTRASISSISSLKKAGPGRPTLRGNVIDAGPSPIRANKMESPDPLALRSTPTPPSSPASSPEKHNLRSSQRVISQAQVGESSRGSRVERRASDPNPVTKSKVTPVKVTSPRVEIRKSPRQPKMEEVSMPAPPPVKSKMKPPEPSPKGKEKAMAAFSEPVNGVPLTSATSQEPIKRVLPPRIRRAAGGGADGIRELEEMIVDWLERWGEPSQTPPDILSIHLTTIPLNLVHPPTFESQSSQPPPPPVTLTPTRSQFTPIPPSPILASPALLSLDRIETPSWIMVDQGEDAEEEARDELGGTVPMSPIKRLRKNIEMEDTSDDYYRAIHRKYEAFERKQKIRERDKLIFERYKMKTRIELLRNLSPHSWVSVVNAVLSRSDESTWAKGREKLRKEGMDWLRHRLVKEGNEVLARYDQLLPSDSKKPKQSRTTFTPTSRSPSPAALPSRVAALREPTPLQKPKRKSIIEPQNGRYSKLRSKLADNENRRMMKPPDGTGRETRSTRATRMTKLDKTEEEVIVWSSTQTTGKPTKIAPVISREEALDMKEVESDLL